MATRASPFAEFLIGANVKTVVIGDADPKSSAVSLETSVNVLFPLFRQSTLRGDTPDLAASGAIVR